VENLSDSLGSTRDDHILALLAELLGCGVDGRVLVTIDRLGELLLLDKQIGRPRGVVSHCVLCIDEDWRWSRRSASLLLVAFTSLA
jgi:hypothetical protein